MQIHNQLSIFLTWDNHDNLYNIHGLHGEGTKIVNRIQGHPASTRPFVLVVVRPPAVRKTSLSLFDRRLRANAHGPFTLEFPAEHVRS